MESRNAKRVGVVTLLLAGMLTAGGARAADFSGCPGGGTSAQPALDALGRVIAAAGAIVPVVAPALAVPPAKKIKIDVQVVLTSREIDRTGNLLRDFIATPEGDALVQRAIAAGDSSDEELDRAIDALAAGFRAASRIHHEVVTAVPGLDVLEPPSLEVYYNEPALQANLKAIMDDYFVSHVWTRWGERFPRSGQRIRNRQVDRPNSIYNRVSWRLIQRMEPEIVGQANARTADFLQSNGIRATARLIPTNGNANGENTGYAVVQADGKTAGGVRFPPNGLLDHDALLSIMRKAASR